jgi:hypothetical protein
VTGALDTALATPGLAVLIGTMALAGLVRGFAGFGTSLIFVPVAGIYLPPAQMVALIMLTGLASSGALVPRAWREGDPREVGWLTGAACVTVPFGLWALARMEADLLRWIASLACAGTLAALVMGWRYRGTVGRPGLMAIGAGAGFIGGLTALTGPLVILFYLAGSRAASVVRANTILFLAALDVVIVGLLSAQGRITSVTLWLAALLAAPYLVATLTGQRLFTPAREGLYRRLAYGVIGAAVLYGLPVWR